MSALRDRLAAGDLDALDDPALELTMMEDPVGITSALLRMADRATDDLLIAMRSPPPRRPGRLWPDAVCAAIDEHDETMVVCELDLMARLRVELRLGQRLRALGPVGCERELRALATLERLCGLT